MAKKKKYYVVWEGHNPGVYTDWNECLKQLKGYSKPVFKAFYRHDVAEAAFHDSPEKYLDENYIEPVLFDMSSLKKKEQETAPVKDALAVDAACSVNPGVMEYRGVDVATGEEVFRSEVYPYGTNNIGEFLAIVHALALMQKHKFSYPLYSDSVTAISWVRKKHCNTQISNNQDNTKILELVKRAEIWLKNNDFSNIKIMKWQTEAWGEIPADFGRK